MDRLKGGIKDRGSRRGVDEVGSGGLRLCSGGCLGDSDDFPEVESCLVPESLGLGSRWREGTLTVGGGVLVGSGSSPHRRPLCSQKVDGSGQREKNGRHPSTRVTRNLGWSFTNPVEFSLSRFPLVDLSFGHRVD